MTTVSVENVIVGEGQSFVDFVVRLDAASATDVTLNYTTFGASAGSSDYTGISGPLTFTAGQTVKTVRVNITNDAAFESIESFGLEIYSVVGASLGQNKAMASIIDNETVGTPNVIFGDTIVDEAAGTATFMIYLDRASASTVTMNYTTQNGSATGGADFTPVGGGLVFTAGQTVKLVTVNITNDATAEGAETLKLVLSSVVNANAPDLTATATIGASDQPTTGQPIITVEDAVVSEGQGWVDFVVRLNAPSAAIVSMSYTTFAMDTNSSDYDGLSGVLTFAAGETIKTVRVGISNDGFSELIESFGIELYSATNAIIGQNKATAVIMDNEGTAGTPVVTIGDMSIDETTGQAFFVVYLDRPSTSVVTMSYTTQDGTATAGSDYEAVSGTLSFMPGQTAQMVAVNITDDAVAEGAESFKLVLSSVTNATAPDLVGSAVIDSSDQATTGQPLVFVEDAIVGESQGWVDFVVRLNAPSASTVTMSYTTFALNASTSDYNGLSGTLAFAAGETVKTIRISMDDENFTENLDSFGLEVYSITGAGIGQGKAIATIVDNDFATGTPVVTIGDMSIDEATGQAFFMVYLDRPSSSVVTMNYATQDGTATAGSDYEAVSGTLSFAPGHTALMVAVSVTNDAVTEAAESFKLVLSSVVNATAPDLVASAVIEASDQATVGQPVASVEDAVVGEGQGWVDFVVRLNAPSAALVTLNYTTFAMNANTADYEGRSGVLSFSPGETLQTVRIPVTQDGNVEGLEGIGFFISNPSGAAIGMSHATATIVDNDLTVGTPVVTVGDLQIDEASGQAFFMVYLDRPSSSTVTMNYATQDGTATAGSDYEATSGTLSFNPGATALMVAVSLTNDAVTEGTESFSLVLSSVTNATAPDTSAVATINSSDQPAVGQPVASIADAMVGEGQGYIDYVIRLNAPSNNSVSLSWSTFASTATTLDYEGVSGTAIFAPGETLKTVRVSIVSDINAESLEAIGFEIYSISGGVIGKGEATITIVDNDLTVGTPVVAIGDMVLDEAAGQATFMVYLDRPSSSTVTMNYATQNGSATAGADYEAASGVLSFAPGQTAHMVTVNITNDAAAEGAESFSLVLSSIVNASAPDTSGTAIIATNDQPASAQPVAYVDDVVVGEAQGYVDFVVRLNAPSNSSVSLSYGTFSQSANTADYAPLSGALVFAAGETLKTVRIAIGNDISVESLQLFGFEIYSPSGAVLGKNKATAMIVDNDLAVGTPVVTIGEMIVDESIGQATFMVYLDRPSASTISMNYATQDGTAVAGQDYEAASGVLLFAAGQTAQMVTVNITNDAIAEGNETFNLVLSSLVNASATDTVGDGTIASSDQTAVLTPAVTVSDAVVWENGGFAEVVIRLSAPSNNAVTMNYQTSSGTAGTFDYEPVAGALVFAPGETLKTIRVPILTDGASDPLDQFSLQVFNVTGATVAQGTGTISIFENFGIGTQGADTINGSAFQDYIAGRDGDDTLIGNDGDDYIFGEGGNDSISGGNGNDGMDGGSGNDTAGYSTAAIGVTVSLAIGVAQNTVGAGNDTLVSIENLTGSAFNDVLTGDGGANILNGGLGNDTLSGGLGIDTASYSDAASGVVVNLAITSAQATGGAGSDTLSSIENLTGSSFNDTLTGDAAANVLAGGGGADVLDGGSGGTDTLDGGSGDDTYIVRFASTTIVDASGSDTVLALVDGLTLAAGIETLSLGEVAGVVSGYAGAGAQTLLGNSLANDLRGGAGDDLFYGQGGDDLLLGEADNDRLLGGAGADRLFGGDGNDELLGEDGEDQLQGGTGSDLLYGGAGNDTMLGEDGADTLFGGDGADLMYGQAGNDTLLGEAGNDQISGGDGADLMYGQDGDDVLLGDADSDRLLGGAGADLLYGQAGDDALQGDADDDRLFGGDGADTLGGGTGADFLYGDAGDDVLQGEDGADQVSGGDGVDLLYGQAGDDVLLGDGEGDRALGGAGADLLYGQAGNDELLGEEDNDTLFGGEGADLIYGQAGTDTLLGENGNDTLSGGDGDDLLYGLGDDDTLLGDNGNDTLFGGAGVDLLYGLAGADALLGEGGNDTLFGGTGADALYGQAGDDVLLGEADDDTLYGGDGADSVLGGAGGDFIQGGAGADTLVGGADGDSFAYALASEGGDSITDFVSGADRFLISAAGFGGGLVAGGSVTLRSGAAPAAIGGGGQFLYNTSTGQLAWDADGTGSGTAVVLATLSGGPIDASDFVVISSLTPQAGEITLEEPDVGAGDLQAGDLSNQVQSAFAGETPAGAGDMQAMPSSAFLLESDTFDFSAAPADPGPGMSGGVEQAPALETLTPLAASDLQPMPAGALLLESDTFDFSHASAQAAPLTPADVTPDMAAHLQIDTLEPEAPGTDIPDPGMAHLMGEIALDSPTVLGPDAFLAG